MRFKLIYRSFGYNLLNLLFFKYLFRQHSFQKHPAVNDYSTNERIGSGYGMARTTDPLTLIFILLRYGLVHRFARGGAVLDLGCGDGVVLRLLSILGVREIIGVESDPVLAHLAKRNVPRANIICADFNSNEFEAKLMPFELSTIYMFNPTSAGEISAALSKLACAHEITAIYRNPQSFGELLQQTEYQIKLKKRFSNYVIFTFIKSK